MIRSDICKRRCCLHLHEDNYGPYCTLSGKHLVEDEEDSQCEEECYDYDNDND